MGWFDEQIRERKRQDQQAFEEGFASIAGAVLGRPVASADSARQAQSAVEEILKYYHAKSRRVPDSVKDFNEQLEFLLRPYGIMRRTVTLEEGWHKDAIGAMLAFRREDGAPTALIPTGLSGYTFFDPATGRRRRVNGEAEKLFKPEAIAFYRPFPQGKIGIPGLMRYIGGCTSWADRIFFALSALAVSLVGLLLPRLNNILFSSVTASGSVRVLAALVSFMLLVSVASKLLEVAKQMLTSRMNTKVSVSVEAASMMRLFALPANFFKKYSTGEMASRVMNIKTLSSLLVSSVASVGLTSLFSLLQISQIFAFAPSLVAPAMIIVLVTTAFSVLTAFRQMSVTQQLMEQSARESGLSYALISGVQKIKLSGAEKRAFAKWSEQFAAGAKLAYDPPMFLKINSVISLAISLTGTLVMYAIAVKSGVSAAEYYAFNSAYAMITAAFTSLAGIAAMVGQIIPILNMAKPILETEPEIGTDKQVVERLSGGIELNNVSFRYGEDTPNVVDDMSLKIRPGQYVAIVGKTGCGKSTLMRLLLGFETPQKGAIYYDGRDMSGLDLKSLRRRMGVVMQDGKLFQGDIYSNITISAPWLTLDDAWEAAEMAGIAEDIRRMPMGMNTMISEGSGGISGGQRQRLLIARAIAPKPRILMFDEATSALDNITQRIVSESLDKLKCTRIVIAHRLSTIRHCDRIIVLDGGRIVEDGTYDELIAADGFFAELVSRQRLDTDSAGESA